VSTGLREAGVLSLITMEASWEVIGGSSAVVLLTGVRLDFPGSSL
jgi:hypothetical protein